VRHTEQPFGHLSRVLSVTTPGAAGDAMDVAPQDDDLGGPWRGGWSGSRDEQFATFMQSATPVLGRMAWLLTGDRHGADELVQLTLVRTYIAWPRARTDDPMAYARRVMANARTDTWRKHRREVPLADDDTSAGSAVTSREHDLAERDALVQALRQLSVRRRRVVVLRYLMDLSEREVADDLNISVGTVKSTAARGLAQLRTLLHQAPPQTVPTSTTHPGAQR